MRLTGAAAVLIVFGAHAAAAAGPLWHRSAKLDYTVGPDGRASATEVWEVRADTSSVAHIIGQQTFSYVADLDRVELMAAYTRKPDGRIIPVPSGSVVDQAVTTTASAPQFTATASRTVVFPQVEAGDTVHYELRRTTMETLFPGEFTVSLAPGSGVIMERAEISLSLPPGRAVRTAAAGLAEAPVEVTPDGKTVRRWRLAPAAAGPIALDASTFADYAALGRAYAARAWPRSRPGEKVRALADRLAPAGLTEQDTVLRLYRHVAREIRYVAKFLGNGRVVPRDAETVLAEGWGDCKDHAALLQALLAAKGIDAEPALISLQNRFDLPDAPGLSALDHVITYVPSLDLFLDSTAPYAPFGLLLASEYDKPVVLAHPVRARLGRTPTMPGGGMVLVTHTNAKIGDDDLVSGHTTTTAAGPQAIALRSMAAWFEGRGTAYAAKIQLQQLGTPGTGSYVFEPPELMAEREYRVEGRFALDEPLVERGTAPFALPGGLSVFGRPGRLLLKTEPTADGLHACYPGREVEEVTLELPPGAQVAQLPKDVQIQSGRASYAAQYAAADGVVTVRRQFTVDTPRQFCSEAEFEPMRKVLNLARRDQQSQISLTRTAEHRVADRL